MIKRSVLLLGLWFMLVGGSVAQDPAGPVLGFSADPSPCADCSSHGSPPRADERFWVRAELPLAWMRPASLPPLVTTSPLGTPFGAAGVLGTPGTTVLTPSEVNGDLRTGFALSAGCPLSCEHHLGLEAGMMILGSQTTGFSAASLGTPILAQPFTNAVTGLPEAAVLAFPGVVSGTVDIQDRSGVFYEGHLDLTETFYDCGCVRLTTILGYRFYRYDESLTIRGLLNSPLGQPAGTLVVNTDQFATRNEFHGPDLGLRADFAWETLSLQLLAKVSGGRLHRTVTIDGSQVITSPGVAPIVRTGGIYALSSNIGSRDDGEWTAFPELGARIGWRIFPGCEIHVGYSWLTMLQIARAADQVNFNINKGLFPPAISTTPSEPSFRLRDKDMWIQSVNFGVQFSF